MNEIKEIRMEIKNATMGYMKENIPNQVLNSSTNTSVYKYSEIIKDKEKMSKRSAFALGKLKHEFERSVLQCNYESKELEDYKSEFQTELRCLEQDLDYKISQITHFNQKRLKDNRELANAYNDETKEIKQLYEEKLQKIREENKRSKNTIKELISSREAELSRINKEIESISKTHENSRKDFDDRILECKEEMKVVQKQRK